MCSSSYTNPYLSQSSESYLTSVLLPHHNNPLSPQLNLTPLCPPSELELENVAWLYTQALQAQRYHHNTPSRITAISHPFVNPPKLQLIPSHPRSSPHTPLVPSQPLPPPSPHPLPPFSLEYCSSTLWNTTNPPSPALITTISSTQYANTARGISHEIGRNLSQ